MKTANEIFKGLAALRKDAEQFTKLSPLHFNLICSTGVAYLVEAAECAWLIDKIAAVPLDNPRIAKEYHQVWKFTLDQEKGGGLLTCHTVGDKLLYTEEITYTTFPLQEITFWAILQGDHRILHFPEEY
jgi:hypothetical protein